MLLKHYRIVPNTFYLDILLWVKVMQILFKLQSYKFI